MPAHGTFLERPPDEVCVALKKAHARGARLASLCRGSFILGAAGVLDGRAVTTHWAWAAELAERYPSVEVQSAKLFVRDGNVYTAAGGTAALDLSLHLIERDHGAGLATATARGIVAPMRRDGGQAQVIHYDVPQHGCAVQETMNWAEHHLHDDLTLADLARHAHMSTRTFTRRFRATVGTTPIDWLLRTRVRRAQELLENTTWTVDRIARVCGFRSVEGLRYHFGRIVGVNPREYRRSFGGTVAAASIGRSRPALLC